MDDVVLIESPEHLRAGATVWRLLDAGHHCVVALNIPVELELRRHGIPYLVLEAYSTRAFERQLSDANLDRAVRLARLIDGYFAERIEPIRMFQMRPARSQTR